MPTHHTFYESTNRKLTISINLSIYIMYSVKVLLSVAAICSLLCAILLLWNESKVTCGYTTTKVLETMFILTGTFLTWERAKL